MIQLSKIHQENPEKKHCLFVLDPDAAIANGWLSETETAYILQKAGRSKDQPVWLNRMDHSWFFIFPDHSLTANAANEKIRKSACKLLKTIRLENISELSIWPIGATAGEILACAEGLALSDYRFDKYKTHLPDKGRQLEKIQIVHPEISDSDILNLQYSIEAVFFCRDLVNEPASGLDAESLAEIVTHEAEKAGIKAETFNKKKIESLKMGGLLAVNQGSTVPPTFTLLEYQPANAINPRPIVLVGKGVTYDTGGMNLKTGTYMDNMKMDMAGAATVSAALIAAARAGLPLHLTALLPATDNRVNSDSVVPGDIITMHNGKTVEILNTDAEGRLILADALSYATKYNPMLVITAATLTGSAMRAIGKYGIAMMQAGAGKFAETLKTSGDEVYERLAELPMWDEYAELLKSDVADLKNIGPPEAGAITAAKFLQAFTDYPFIHLDIAGTSFAESADSYRGKGGTGTGVRLLFHFLRTLSQSNFSE